MVQFSMKKNIQQDHYHYDWNFTLDEKCWKGYEKQ